MNFSKQIIDEFVSYIDLKDVQEFVKQNPELSQKETKSTLKIYEQFKMQNSNENSFKKQKIFKTSKNNLIIWNFFPY